MMRSTILVLAIILLSCHEKDSKEEVNRLLEKGRPEDLVKAFYLIGEKRDTSFVKEIIINPYDPRVVHAKEFYGISVYQSKMIALKKISGISPPVEITNQPDSSVFEFYCHWVNENTSIRCK